MFTEKEASLVVKDIVSALDFLHKKGTYTVSSLLMFCISKFYYEGTSLILARVAH